MPKAKKKPVKVIPAGTYAMRNGKLTLVRQAAVDKKSPGGHKPECWPKVDDLCTAKQKKKFAAKLMKKGITPDLVEEDGRVKIRISSRADRKRIYEALDLVDRDAGMSGDPKASSRHEEMWKEQREKRENEQREIDAREEFIREFESHGQGIVDDD